MANKKSGKKQKRIAKTSSKKAVRATKPASKKPATKSANNKKPAAKKKSTLKKTAAKTSGAAPKKAASAKTANVRTKVQKKPAPARGQRFNDEPYEVQGLISGSTTESGDTQGLSNVESADSESVDELVEEGNAFEADAVAGVERAGDRPGKEVRTHEVPEDDVPEEYLDQD
jgi:hypothetical protein